MFFPNQSGRVTRAVPQKLGGAGRAGVRLTAGGFEFLPVGRQIVAGGPTRIAPLNSVTYGTLPCQSPRDSEASRLDAFSFLQSHSFSARRRGRRIRDFFDSQRSVPRTLHSRMEVIFGRCLVTEAARLV